MKVNILFNHLLQSIQEKQTLCLLVATPDELKQIVKFLKYHTSFKGIQLVNITRIDHLYSTQRFSLKYIFHQINPRKIHPVQIIIQVKACTIHPIPTITSTFKSAAWYEREIWDLYGIFFMGNPNLRRILNDYGFNGHPFRKDFPLVGYTQLQYDLDKKRLISTHVELAQQFRT